MRYYKYDNSLQGFFGYSAAYYALSRLSSGMASCFAPRLDARTPPAPTSTMRSSATGTVPRVNLTYKFTPEVDGCTRRSRRGFRPGGVNRTAVQGSSAPTRPTT